MILHKHCLAGGTTEGHHHPVTGKGSRSHPADIILPPLAHTPIHAPCPEMAGMTVRCSSIMLLNLNPRDWAVRQTTRLSGVRGNILEAIYFYQQGALLFPPLKLARLNT